MFLKEKSKLYFKSHSLQAGKKALEKTCECFVFSAKLWKHTEAASLLILDFPMAEFY